MTANARQLDRPVTGSVLRSGMRAAPRPVSAGRLVVAALPSAPFWARRYTSGFLGCCHGITEETAEVALLLVSELVTNAALVSGDLPGHESSYTERTHVPSIDLSLRYFRDGLLIEVFDSSPKSPALRRAGPDAECGRGLMLIDALSREWGYFPAPDGGKVVFCFLEITLEAGMVTTVNAKRLPEETISQWANSAILSQQVAARLARELRSAPQWFPVESDRSLSGRLDVSSTTVSEAKRLLAAHQVIARHGTTYHVS